MDELSRLRHEIDRLDESLIEILAERFRVTREIGHLKNAMKLPPLDRLREEQQAGRIRALASSAGLREDVALIVLRVILNVVVDDHKRIQEGDKRESQ